MKAKLVQEVLNEGCGCGGKKRPRPTVAPTQRPNTSTQRPRSEITRNYSSNNHVLEKFSETGDPIKDMGIGINPRKEAQKFIDNFVNVDITAHDYFGSHQYSGLSYILWGFFKNILKGQNVQDAFFKSAENENFYGNRPDIVKHRKTVTDVIQKHHHLDVDPNDKRLILR